MHTLAHIIETTPLVIFGMESCPWCQKAKELLKSQKPLFVPVGPEHRAELKRLTGKTSVPQIYRNGKLLGGYTDTAALLQKEKGRGKSRSRSRSRRYNRTTRKLSRR
jgi:glutaredoxin 3